MKNNRIIAVFLCLIMALILFVGCGKKADVISVGSKDFTESYILAELYALGLEEVGYEVDRKFNLGGTTVITTAMERGDVDLYPEYTGTCLINVLKEEPISDKQELYDFVAKEYLEKFNLKLTKASDAENSQALAITKAASKKYGIKTISDLQEKASNIRFATQGAFEVNSDGMPILEKVYGKFDFKSKTTYDNALKFQIVENDNADLIIAFTSDGQLAKGDVIVLEDDKHAWTSYNIVPICRNEAVEKFDKMEAVLNIISENLTTETLQRLNGQVDIDKREPRAVSKEYFNENLKALIK